jgi:hypothetical protein
VIEQKEAMMTHDVYKAIAAIQGELSKEGIGKNRTNQTPGANYKFRGIDDVYNALSPLLAKHGLCILPRMLSRDVVERKSAKGNALFYVTLEAEFDFVAASDGSKHTVRTFGEAMDSGDKATNKAMSAAYKYAAFQAFAIPTEGDNDADSTTHEVVAAVINDDQYAALRDLIEATDANIDIFCQYYKIEALTDLPVSRFEHARKSLSAKLPENRKAA